MSCSPSRTSTFELEEMNPSVKLLWSCAASVARQRGKINIKKSPILGFRTQLSTFEILVFHVESLLCERSLWQKWVIWLSTHIGEFLKRFFRFPQRLALTLLCSAQQRAPTRQPGASRHRSCTQWRETLGRALNFLDTHTPQLSCHHPSGRLWGGKKGGWWSSKSLTKVASLYSRFNKHLLPLSLQTHDSQFLYLPLQREREEGQASWLLALWATTESSPAPFQVFASYRLFPKVLYRSTCTSNTKHVLHFPRAA